MLRDPTAVGVFYTYNTDFLQNLADKVFFGARNRGMRTLDREELVNEAFVLFIELLPQKPRGKGIREFCFWPIYRRLVEYNRSHFREVLFGKEEYFDLFKSDAENF
jgi:hypothetical protein